MKKGLSYWFRWILAIPVSVIAGGLVNLLLLGIFSIFIDLKTASDSTVNTLNFILFPIIIGFVSIQIGSKIAPLYTLKTASILLGIIILLQIGSVLSAPLSEGNNPILQAVMTAIGGGLGVLIVAKYSKVEK
jgi:hypothetical protein